MEKDLSATDLVHNMTSLPSVISETPIADKMAITKLADDTQLPISDTGNRSGESSTAAMMDSKGRTYSLSIISDFKGTSSLEKENFAGHATSD